MAGLSVQGWPQLAALGTALVLCSLIGWERQLRNKSAGLRTHTLVGVGAALFVLLGKWGFADMDLGATDGASFDPARVAAQVASGVGFIGAGLIFVRGDAVRGLTTAATVWLAAAVGSAAGAGLWLLAGAATAAHFLVAYAYPALTRRFTRGAPGAALLEIRYLDGQGALRSILAEATERDFAVRGVRAARTAAPGADPVIALSLLIAGSGTAESLVGPLAEVPGVVGVEIGDPDDADL